MRILSAFQIPTGRWCRLVLAASLFLLSLPFLPGDVPLPSGVLQPTSIPEAWNVIRLTTENVEQLLAENRLGDIQTQLSLCNPALRALVRLKPDPTDKLTRLAVTASNTINAAAQASAVGDATVTADQFQKLRATLAEMGGLFDPTEVQAEIWFCPMHPDFTALRADAVCEKCGMTLLRRRIPRSFVYMPPGQPSIVLEAGTDEPLAAGKPVLVHLCMHTQDGKPVSTADLLVVHTQPIHLLIIDTALRDYHHEHPQPTGTPGEYTFRFTPSADTAYRIFADVVPAATGIQEYPRTDLPGGQPDEVIQKSPDTFSSQVGGLTFTLSFGGPLHAGQVQPMNVQINDADGKPFRQLEPVMNAFAHAVGFYEDRQTVVHIHPEGGEILNPSLRGGPALSFRFYPPKAGFLRLYCQVQVNGQMLFAPFDVNVLP